MHHSGSIRDKHQHAHTRNRHTNLHIKEQYTNHNKSFTKHVLKGKAHRYGHESARNIENRTTVEKISLSEDLHYQQQREN